MKPPTGKGSAGQGKRAIPAKATRGSAGAVRFAKYIVRAAEFQEIGLPEGDPAQRAVPDEGASQLSLSARVGIGQDVDPIEAELTLDAVITCDPARQPYHIHVVVTGLFVGVDGTTEAEMKSFLTGAAPAVLFPFIRSEVASLTHSARYGPVLMDLVNLSEMLKQAELIPMERGEQAAAGDA